MREIIFRGKTETGEWLYGSLERRDQVDRIGGYEITGPTRSDPGGDTLWIYDNVIRETVGQFTGLKDKNGKDIFEGDLILNYQSRVKSDGKIAKGYPETITLISEIVFKKGSWEWPERKKPIPEHEDAFRRYNYREYSEFHLVPSSKGSQSFNKETSKWDVEGDDQTVRYVEVIGNIHDNPELLI